MSDVNDCPLGVRHSGVDTIPGRFGDWSKVMSLIVTDSSHPKRGCVRTFTTLDGLVLGEVTDKQETPRPSPPMALPDEKRT